MPCLHKYRVGHNTLSTQVLGRPTELWSELEEGLRTRLSGHLHMRLLSVIISDHVVQINLQVLWPCIYNTSCVGCRLSKGEIWNEMEPMEQNGTSGTLFYLADIAQQSSLL